MRHSLKEAPEFGLAGGGKVMEGRGTAAKGSLLAGLGSRRWRDSCCVQVIDNIR